MNDQLLLKNIRSALNRQEETIIFALLERGQFALNPVVYRRSAFDPPARDDSLVGYLLHETEKIHARVRRYTSPDEHPFYDDLPEPVLEPLQYNENPLYPNDVNINSSIRSVYEQEIVPTICQNGDDAQYGSSAVADVSALQALSRRIHYGKFVAESKYQDEPGVYREAIASDDKEKLRALITNEDVEERVLERVTLKARTYGREIEAQPDEPVYKLAPETIVRIYSGWVIPLTKEVQLQYLLRSQRPG